MNSDFILCHKNEAKKEKINSSLTKIGEINHWFAYANRNVTETKGVKILIDGFVIPRNSIYNKYKHANQEELIAELYISFGETFIDKIKGFFTIIIIDSKNDKIIIVNDIHSVKRFYKYEKNGEPFITNNIHFLKPFNIEFNEMAPVIQAGFQHMILGYTQYKNVHYSLPASQILLQANKINQSTYFNPSELSTKDKTITTKLEFIEAFHTSISNTINFLKPQTISTTLTGGRDTRSILAVLLNLNLNPQCFTFGYPEGIDVITAKSITKHVGLKFSNHYIKNLNKESYEQLVNEVISINNPFIHLHRAHRLDAVKKEQTPLGKHPDMIFVGAMGGDYIMGEKFNDYILTVFLRRFLTEKNPSDDIINQILKQNFIKPDKKKIEFIYHLLSQLNLKQNTFNKNVEFNLVHNIIGSTHDIQDLNVFLKYTPYVIAPFMDIDIMEKLFSSPYSLFSNNRHTKNPFKRLKGGELQCSLVKQYAPELANLKFANQYTPNDVLGNQLKYVLKRIYLHTYKIKSKPTFSYDNWFNEFILEKSNHYKNFIDLHYDWNKIYANLLKKEHLTIEGYWHKHSNPVTLAMYNKIVEK